jgi:hypothetical protein
VVIGHVHQPADEARVGPRLVVLGGWQRRSSFLRIDENGATLHIEHDHEPDPEQDARQPQPSLAHYGGNLGKV